MHELISLLVVNVLELMLGEPPKCTRFDGRFSMGDRSYNYSAYLIAPKVGKPTIRIDIREVL